MTITNLASPPLQRYVNSGSNMYDQYVVRLYKELRVTETSKHTQGVHALLPQPPQTVIPNCTSGCEPSCRICLQCNQQMYCARSRRMSTTPYYDHSLSGVFKLLQHMYSFDHFQLQSSPCMYCGAMVTAKGRQGQRCRVHSATWLSQKQQQ